MKVKIFGGKYLSQMKLCFTLMSVLIVTAVKSVEEASSHIECMRMYVTPQKFMSVFMKKLSLRELLIGYLRIVCFPTIEDTGNSCSCIRQGISVVMSDSV